jgi:hypothetical protein
MTKAERTSDQRMTPTRLDAACMVRGVSIIGVSTSFCRDAKDQSDKSYSHLLYEHLLGLENHITAVVSARAGPILSWLKSLPLTSICSWAP